MMVYLSLLLIAILTVASGATSLYCSDVQSPASGNGGNTDPSQVTTLQYCIIDNCTIMRIDTGQQLDIVYTTESLLIVTPKDGHTSMAIAKIDDELPCVEYPNTTSASQTIKFIQTVIGLLITAVSAYVLIVHLLFKTYHSTLFGKLLIFYNLCSVSAHVISLLLLHNLIAANSQAICHAVMVTFALSSAGTELFATNILYHLAYIMYRCYHLKAEISKKRSEYLFKCYTTYAGFALILLLFITIAYDWRTGNGKYTISENGRCGLVDLSNYNTFFFTLFIVTINKFLQITMFSAYLVYLYKFNLNVHAAQITLRYSRLLFKIAIAMGATVGVAFFIYILVAIMPEHSDIILTSGGIIELVQQTVIMTSFMCTKTMYALCKGYCVDTNTH